MDKNVQHGQDGGGKPDRGVGGGEWAGQGWSWGSERHWGGVGGVKGTGSVGLRDAFSVTYHVPTLRFEDAKKVLQQLNVFSEHEIDVSWLGMQQETTRRIELC
ncbi:hypothetical protein Droror1_Dr00012689 [Drosera rotundifolia]